MSLQWCQWLMPVILATQEDHGSKPNYLPRQILLKTLSQKNPSQKVLVEWLKVLALNSNTSTAKKRERNVTLVFVFYFVGVTGFEFRVLCLLGKCSTT
jgi:hypothetical protein